MSKNPTPWKQAEDKFSIFIEDANGKIIADVRNCNMTMEEHRARAKLFAAAPDMLAALKDIQEALVSKDGRHWFSVNHAIEKAEGKL